MRLQIPALLFVFFISIFSLHGIVLAQTATASSTTQIIQTLDGNLAYIEMTKPDELYSYRIPFNPPDGISKLLSIEVSIQGDFLPTTVIKVNLGESSCEPRNWQTPKWEVAGYRTVFECTNLANEKTKELAFSFTTSQESRNVKVWYKISYYNDWNLPEKISEEVNLPTMALHGTDYYTGELGKVWLQLLDANKNAINNGICNIDIYYPYGSKFINHANMNFIENGLYFYDLMIPEAVGIYPVLGNCYFSTVTQEETADSGYINIGTNDANSYLATQTKNNVYWKIDEASSGGKYRLDFGLNFTGINQPALLAEIQVIWSGKWNGGSDYLTVYIYNFTSGTWIAFFNIIPDTDTNRIDISNSITTSNASASGLLYNYETRIRITDTSLADAVSSKVQTDYLAVDFISFTGQGYQDVKGSSELNVKSRNIGAKDTVVSTSCGSIEYEEPSTCGEFANFDSGANYSEQEIQENITVTSLAGMNDTESYWEYWTTATQDCTSIYYIEQYNGTAWVDVYGDAEMHTHPETENCHIKMPVTVDVNEVLHYRVIMDNYLKWEVMWIKNVKDVVETLISPSCMLYASQHNYTFTIPIFDGTFVNRTDTTLFGCHKYLDDLYWIDYYYNLSLNATTVREYTSYFTELRWYEAALRQHNQLYTSMLLRDVYAHELLNNFSAVWDYPNRSVESNFYELKYKGGTEYSGGETGITSVQFQRISGGNPIVINDGLCNVTINYPNGSIFISNAGATHLSGSNGIYRYTFTVPTTYGIYDTDFHCIKVNTDAYASGSFHVSNWTAQILGMPATLSIINSHISDVNISIYSRLNQIDSKIDSIHSDLLLVNTSLHSDILAINNSIMSKLFTLQSELSAVNQSIYNRFGQTDTLILSVNSSLANQIYTLQADVLATYNQVINTYAQVNATNQSIMNKLYLIQGDLANIYTINQEINSTIHIITINLTPVLNFLTIMNSTMLSEFGETRSAIYAVNVSIMNKLYLIQSDLQGITDDIAELALLIDDINQTTMNKLTSIQSDINLLGVQIDAVNVSIMNKLYGIQGEITSVNDTLIGYLMNITNITANITLNQEAIFDDLVALWGDQIAKPSYYSAGLTGFLPSVSAQSDDTQYVCIDNYTLETRKNIFLETPSGNKTYVRTLQTTCTYGCINNTCVMPNYMIFIILIIAIIVVYVLYRHFFM